MMEAFAQLLLSLDGEIETQFPFSTIEALSPKSFSSPNKKLMSLADD